MPLRSVASSFMRLTGLLGLAVLLGTPARSAPTPSALPTDCRASALEGGAGRWTPPGAQLRVVALGSSSTFGQGASTPAQSYPAQLRALLRSTGADEGAEVWNKGVNGDTLARISARLDRDVYALRPNVVILQTATNDALQRVPLEQFQAQLVRSVQRFRERGIGVILLDSQYLPADQRPADFEEYQRVVWDVARELDVPLVPRYALMRDLVASGRYPIDALLAPDRLHPNDWMYACTATYLADLLAVRRPR